MNSQVGKWDWVFLFFQCKLFSIVMKIGVYPNCNQTTDRHEAEIRKKVFAKEKCLHVTGEVGK